MEYQIWYRLKSKTEKEFGEWMFMSAYKAQIITGDERGAWHENQRIDLGYVQARSRVLNELSSVHLGLYDISKDYQFKITEGADHFTAADGEQTLVMQDLKKEDLPGKRFGQDEIFYS